MGMNAVEPDVSFIILSTGKPNNLTTNPTERDPNELKGPRHSCFFVIFFLVLCCFVIGRVI